MGWHLGSTWQTGFPRLTDRETCTHTPKHTQSHPPNHTQTPSGSHTHANGAPTPTPILTPYREGFSLAQMIRSRHLMAKWLQATGK